MLMVILMDIQKFSIHKDYNDLQLSVLVLSLPAPLHIYISLPIYKILNIKS